MEASIHFPLAREDVPHQKLNGPISGFNPLPSCEGRHVISGRCADLFNASIHFPLAREDSLLGRHGHWPQRFNPLPSCEGRRPLNPVILIYWIASIHFPLAREDAGDFVNPSAFEALQSTSLLRGKTFRTDFRICEKKCFNPLPSCEGRQAQLASCCCDLSFNPLPSCEGRPA